jgi:hypothetical protein
MENFIKQIQEHPYYQVTMFGDKPIIVFEDHRFVIPILWLAQKMQVIDGNINMIRFDGHFDALNYQKAIDHPYRRLTDFSSAYEFAKDKLGAIDDDWQTFAFDQNLVNRVLIFCDRKEETNVKYADRIFSLKRLDGILGYNGEFADETPQPVWDVIGWKIPGIMDNSPVLLDIDCDYFTYQWRGSILPWQKEFYEKEFSPKSEAHGWSNRSFMELLIAKAPFVTICLEPDFCGGREHANQILSDLQKNIFNI